MARRRVGQYALASYFAGHPFSWLPREFALESPLGLTVCALTPAGNDSLTAAAEWCRRATEQELGAFQLPYNVLTGRFRVPSEKTLRRVLGLLDPAEVSAAGFAHLRPVLDQAAGRMPSARTPDGLIEREQRRAHRRAQNEETSTPRRRALAVDGKCLRLRHEVARVEWRASRRPVMR